MDTITRINLKKIISNYKTLIKENKNKDLLCTIGINNEKEKEISLNTLSILQIILEANKFTSSTENEL